jgi:hypothetical protein
MHSSCFLETKTDEERKDRNGLHILLLLLLLVVVQVMLMGAATYV